MAIKAVSGWSWDDERGVDVSPATQGTWDAFVAAHPTAAQFRNRGWPFFDLMEALMPSAAKGTHVFRPGAASNRTDSSPSRKSPSPDWDESQMARDDFGDDAGGSGSNPGGQNDDEDDEEDRPVRVSSMTVILLSDTDAATDLFDLFSSQNPGG